MIGEKYCTESTSVRLGNCFPGAKCGQFIEQVSKLTHFQSHFSLYLHSATFLHLKITRTDFYKEWRTVVS